MSTEDQFKAAIAALKNDRHRKFVAAYLLMIADGKPNAAEAYRQAGFKASNPQVAAASADNLLRRAEIKAIVDSAREQAKAASTAAVEAAAGSLEWKRAKLIEITNAGLANHVDDNGKSRRFDIKASIGAIGLLAKIDGDEKPQVHEHRAHESLLEMLR